MQSEQSKFHNNNPDRNLKMFNLNLQNQLYLTSSFENM
jgi:hypothetical protein